MAALVSETLPEVQKPLDRDEALANPREWIAPLDNDIALAKLEAIRARGEDPIVMRLEDERTVVFQERWAKLKSGKEPAIFSARLNAQDQEAMGYDELFERVSQQLLGTRTYDKGDIVDGLNNMISKLVRIRVPEDQLGMWQGISHIGSRLVCFDDRFSHRKNRVTDPISPYASDLLAIEFKEERLAALTQNVMYEQGYLSYRAPAEPEDDLGEEPNNVTEMEVTGEWVLLHVSRYIGDRTNDEPGMAIMKPYHNEIRDLLDKRRTTSGINRGRIQRLLARLSATGTMDSRQAS